MRRTTHPPIVFLPHRQESTPARGPPPPGLFQTPWPTAAQPQPAASTAYCQSPEPQQQPGQVRAALAQIQQQQQQRTQQAVVWRRSWQPASTSFTLLLLCSAAQDPHHCDSASWPTGTAACQAQDFLHSQHRVGCGPCCASPTNYGSSQHLSGQHRLRWATANSLSTATAAGVHAVHEGANGDAVGRAGRHQPPPGRPGHPCGGARDHAASHGAKWRVEAQKRCTRREHQ